MRLFCCHLLPCVAYWQTTAIGAMNPQHSEERKDPTLTVRVDQDFKDRLQEWADAESRPLSNFVRWWLEQYPKLHKERVSGN